jgi:CheY-like chemotaxis protein
MKSILLIEDDPFLIDIYSTKLKEAGFKVEVATDGEEGLTKLKEKIPDVILLDIVLPKIDGWEILQRIKEIKEKVSNKEKIKFNNLKVVVLSNLGQKEDVEKG